MDKTVQKIPFLRLSAALATGILLGSVIQPDPLILFLSVFLLLCVLFLVNRCYRFQLVILFGAGIQLVFVLAGILVHTIYNQKPEFHDEGKFSATVMEIMQEKPNSYQTVLRINMVYKNATVFSTKEMMMAWFAKTEDAQQLKPGETVLFDMAPQMIKNSNNPYEFDYKTYLAQKKIYRQVYLPADRWVKSDIPSGFSMPILAEKVRMHLLDIYLRQNLDEKELHVLSALTLGYKRGLDPETKRIFASAGAMHVLAVSGLHVGIVFMVFSVFFGFMKRRKSGRLVFVFLVVLVLWCFAFITGLSPSVKRAATMFSFVVIGDGIKRRSNIYNTLAASAFFLLLFNPNNLFEAGFQLSYAAVFGIVFLQPRIEKLFMFKNKILHYSWSLLTVSVSAQIATFPVSVFYFNQFPVYFWISNLLVIPAVTFLIPMGMLLLFLSWIPWVSQVTAFAIGFVLRHLIHFLEFIERLPFSVVEFSFSALELAFILGVLFSVFFFIETSHKRYFKAALLFLLLMVTTSLVMKTYNLFRKEIIVYNHSGQTVIHLVSGRNNYIVSEEKIAETEIAKKLIDNTVRKMRLHEPFYLTSNEFYRDLRLYLKNGMIFFEGRTIALGENPVLESILPEFLIGPWPETYAQNIQSSDQKFISTLRYRKENSKVNSPVFSLNERGAFREKW